mgnify:CR=1 FL=1
MNSRSTLKTYLIRVFVPLTGLPLLVLAALTFGLTSRSFDEELARRAKPELSAVARSFETAERQFAQQLARAFRGDETPLALAARDVEALGGQAQTWLETSLFQRVNLYAADGSRLAGAEARSRSAPKAWEALFAPSQRADGRDPASTPTGEAREAPASAAFQASSERAEEGRLRGDFRQVLASEENFVARRLDAGAGFTWTVYRALRDAERRVVGYAEAEATLDAVRLKILARYHGFDLALLSEDRTWILASNPAVDAAFSAWHAARARVGALPEPSRPAELVVRDEPVSLFFADLAPVGGAKGWVAIALSRADQLKLRNEILLWVLALAAALAALVAFITVHVSKRLTAPISALVEAAERVRQGEWVHPVTVDSRTELGFLASRFNDMALSVQVTKRTLESKLEELARAHEEITQTQAQLVQSAKMSSLGQLVAGVAHELNNPIAFIYSNMSQARSYLKDLERLDALLREVAPRLDGESRRRFDHELAAIEWDEVRRDLGEIVQSCLEGSIRVKDIVLGLRNFSRADQGDFVELDLRRALENTVKLLNAQIKNRVEIDWNVEGPTSLRCNEGQINQVLMNLVANAVQAIEGKGHVSLRVRTEESDGRNFRVITVRDTGRGIGPEHIDRIFDPFFTTKKVGEGTGLGLSIVYGIVERHRGTIHVRSQLFDPRTPEAEHGTEFIVRLPVEGAPAGLERAS